MGKQQWKSLTGGLRMLFITSISLLITPAYFQETDCHFGKDLALVFDIGGGISESDHNALVAFGLGMVETIQQDNLTRLAILSYDVEARMRLSLKEWSVTTATVKIFNVFARWEASNDQTHRAMRCMRTQTFTADYGDRPSMPNLVYLVTDRRSSDPTEALRRAELLKDTGTAIFIISIAGTLTTVEMISYATDIDHMWIVASFADLHAGLNNFLALHFSCDRCNGLDCENEGILRKCECICGPKYDGNRCQYGKPVQISSCTASSEYNFHYSCERAYDGLYDTGSTEAAWATSAEGSGSWIKLNLVHTATLGCVRLTQRGVKVERYKDIQLEFSDGTTQSTLLDYHDCNCYEWDEISLNPVLTSWVKITGVTTYTTFNNGFAEIELFTEACADIPAAKPLPVFIQH